MEASSNNFKRTTDKYCFSKILSCFILSPPVSLKSTMLFQLHFLISSKRRSFQEKLRDLEDSYQDEEEETVPFEKTWQRIVN
jgi:hypothetical protein